MPVTPLYRSLFELCRRQINADKEFLLFKNWFTTPKVDMEIFEEYRLFKLRRTLAYVAQHSRFYKRLFAESGIEPEEIRTIADLAVLPFTSAEEIAADPYAFLCTSQGMVERAITFTSSGTVGPQKRVFFSEPDIEAMTDYMAVGIKTVADSSDVVQILLPEGPVMGQCDLLARGVCKMGARPVITGLFIPPEMQIQAIRDNGSTVLFGETHLIYRITKMMESKYNLRELGIRALFLTTSYASEEMINYLHQAWNAQISTHYGLTEMGLGLAVGCPGCGYNHFNELDVIGEVIDPVTGKSLAPGSIGELVFTTIQREAMPLIRYRTKDRALLGEPSESCGSPLRTLGAVKYRVESLVPFCDGAFIYPTLFHNSLFKIPEIVDYDLSVNTLAGKDMLIFDIEAFEPEDCLRQRILESIHENQFIQSFKPSEFKICVNFKTSSCSVGKD